MPTLSIIIPTYRSAPAALRTVRALRACDRGGYLLDIVVVDDGSGDNTTELFRSSMGDDVLLISHPRNLGRVAARNTGMAAARGDMLLFIDADCVPVGTDLLVAHLAVAAPGACSAGSVTSDGGGFWDDYQGHAASRRRRAAGTATFTSANFMVSRAAMASVGGFDPAFRGYGFEDRDLALRLMAAGVPVLSNERAAVTHNDALDLPTVCLKMIDAGSGNAALFARRHPDAYRALGYAAVDTRLKPGLRIVHAIAERLRDPAIRWLAPRLEGRSIPFGAKVKLVRLLVALSFLHGTTIDRR